MAKGKDDLMKIPAAACIAVAAFAVYPATTANLKRTALQSRSGPVQKGAAFQWNLVQSEPAYGPALLSPSRNYKYVTPEYEMYIDHIQWTRGVYDFRDADAMLEYTQANGIELRGHALIWGLSLPSWLTSPSVPWTRTTLLAEMQRWITTVVSRYRGSIKEWVVVNESFNDDGGRTANIWQNVIGNDYIEQAFRFARAADPTARLFYNDYNTDWAHPKSDAVYNMVKDFKARRVPIDGVGFQEHRPWQFPVPYADLLAQMNRLGALGVRTDVTEMDFDLTGFPGTQAQALASQATSYDAAAHACQAAPSCFRFGTWGFVDSHSWLGAGAQALPFDASYNAKPAWTSIINRIGL